MRRSRLLAPGIFAAACATLCLLPAPAAHAQFDYFGKNKVQYREFDWRIYHSPHFDVYYYTAEENLLQPIVSFAESAYDHLSREFDYQIKEATPLIFYATHSAFEQNNVIYNFIPESTGAFASPVRNRMVLPVDLPNKELLALITHELTHIFQYHILFEGRLGRGLALRPPTWFMEGMASYMGKDETEADKMVLRDAAVNDRIPALSQGGVEGYFAYRIGHAAFDYIEERWGKEGFRDFVFEFRNTIGSRVDRAIKRTFHIEPEDFDTDFRRWLRKKYLPKLVETGEPGDFGRPFFVQEAEAEGQGYEESAPAASPSGDLVASFAIYRSDLDIVLFDAKKRQLLRNLTKGFTNQYQYLIGQSLTVGRRQGNDLAFSPDGNSIAVFARRDRGRSLLLIDVLHGGIKHAYDMDVEQQLSPAWSPDGKQIVFSGNQEGRFDLYLLDVASGDVHRLTDDTAYDGAPTFSPDGKSVVWSTEVGGAMKLFRLDLDKPGERYQLTQGPSNDLDAVFSPDGRQVFFSSDRDGAFNIWGLDLETGSLRQFTNVVTGCFTPTLLTEPGGGPPSLVYSGYWNGDYRLYRTGTEEPVKPATTAELPQQPTPPETIKPFEPDIQVSVDKANEEKYHGFKFFLEDAQTQIAVDTNQTVLGQVVLNFSDYLGDRRLFTVFSSVDSLSNFEVLYLNAAKRRQWSLYLFDQRDFYIAGETASGELVRSRQAFRQTGAIATLIYPFSFYHRFEIGGGYINREIALPRVSLAADGSQVITLVRFQDDFPLVQTALVGDSALYAPWGGIGGRRWRLAASWAPDLKEHGTLTTDVYLDARQYLPTSLRSNFAFRFFGAESFGNRPDVFYFGGLDTLRGFGFRELVGDRAYYANIEWRFPLIDTIATPILRFQGIRGRIFLDVGAAWFSDQPFRFYDGDTGRLKDGVAAYGWGFTVRFLGLELNWDFAQRWDLKDSSGVTTSFFIGQSF